MSDVLGALFAITLSLAMIVSVWRYGVAGVVEFLNECIIALMGATERLVRRLAHGPSTRRTVGLRPNQPRPSARRLLAGSPRCRHTADPVKVEVRDTLDGRPEVVAWLCPDCIEEVREPPEAALDKVTSVAEYTAWTRAYPEARAALRALGHARWRRPPSGRGGVSRARPPRDEGNGEGYCGFCNGYGHSAIACDALIRPKAYVDSTIIAGTITAEQIRGPACLHPDVEIVQIRGWGMQRAVREIPHCPVCSDTIEPAGRPEWVHSVPVDQTERPAPLQIEPPDYDVVRH